MMFKILQECEQTHIMSTTFNENVNSIFVDSRSILALTESAESILNDVLSDIENKVNPFAEKDGQQMLDMLTGLILLSNDGNAQAFNLPTPKVSDIIKLAGENANVNKTLSFIAAHGKTLQAQLQNEFKQLPTMTDQQRTILKNKFLKIKALCDKLMVTHGDWSAPGQPQSAPIQTSMNQPPA